MLSYLRIRDFAIIESLEAEFNGGLNVITGETGAGKSILIHALQLVMGARARADVVRTGCKAAEVEALFNLGSQSRAVSAFAAQGVDVESGELVVRRVIQKEGRTRAYLNGKLVTTTQLAELTRGMADICSQHQYHSLTDASTHLHYLDAFAELGELRAKLSGTYEQLARAHQELADLERAHHDLLDKAGFLRFQVQEIEQAAPVADEEQALEQERARLRHAEALATAATAATSELYDADQAICSRLAKIQMELAKLGDFDSALVPWARQIQDAQAQLEDAAAELGRYARGIQMDPARLQEVDDRLDLLQRLKRKHGGTIEEVIARLDQLKHELERLDRHDEQIEELRNRQASALSAARELATELSARRKACAEDLAGAMGQQLASLGMGGARVVVDVAQTRGRDGEIHVQGAQLTSTGIDRVEFLIAPNPGEAPRPLHRIASGGELSRALLAIKRVLAGLGVAGLYVFDEVDAGVGGGVAAVIGRKLKAIAQHDQVLCITHLPQIAAYADAHYQVQKTEEGGRTHSSILRLAPNEQLEELARMLGGLRVTQRTRAAARELLREASGQAERKTKTARTPNARIQVE